ncbi:MAG: DUF4260 domain-containing protein [Chloroflexi bacterium]|nr:DUF4260 domain-containing protein [Chloroflexota bacterium]
MAVLASPNAHSRGAMTLPNLLLRLEAAILLAASLIVYGTISGDWLAFALLLFVPDLSAIGYLVNVRIGSLSYNLIHTYALPILLFAAGWALSVPVLLPLATIWFAHISMDRILGYGLKYPTIFKDTHLQRV